MLRLRLAKTLIPVIARSKATWQSTPTLSLRGAQRRGNPYPPVIARSKATWQSTPTLSLRGAKRRGNPYPPRHCEERSDVAIHTHPVIARSAATWQSIFQAVPDARWIASPSARNDGGAARNDPISCHCEEQSDVAIHTPLSLRGAKRRGNPYLSSFQCIYLGSVVSQ